MIDLIVVSTLDFACAIFIIFMLLNERVIRLPASHKIGLYFSFVCLTYKSIYTVAPVFNLTMRHHYYHSYLLDAAFWIICGSILFSIVKRVR